MAMTRNSESHFATNPVDIDIKRSKFNRPSWLKTTFNTGDLIPIFVDEALPGDTFSMSMSMAARMSTPLVPVMDNANIDIYFFSVPYRLVWNHWREFNGENRLTHWEQPTDYQIPQIKAPSNGWQKGTIADYMGLPTQVAGLSVSSLFFRAYCLVWNEWFRDQNLKDPCMINLDEATQQGSNTGDYVTNAQLGALPLKVAKYHDYFTSALPEPQKGPDVKIPLGAKAPIETLDDDHVEVNNTQRFRYYDGNGDLIKQNWSVGVQADGTGCVRDAPTGTWQANVFSALYTDLSNATAASINSLRQAFALQRLYETDARGGTRYTEMIRAHFGVVSPDARMQRPEYLGGKRIPVTVNQVLQTSSTDATTPQGHTAGYSLTNDVDTMFSKSFTEHEIIIGLAAVRTEHTYQQGIDRMWSRKLRTDFYLPELANIGEQAILNKEIYAQGNAEDDEAFGYQEAWAEYRYKPSHVTGAFRSNYAQSLDYWHYGDDYSKRPTLSSAWIDETRENVNRTIAVQDEVEDQWLADFYFDLSVTRPMPLYSIPGMIGHV